MDFSSSRSTWEGDKGGQTVADILDRGRIGDLE